MTGLMTIEMNEESAHTSEPISRLPPHVIDNFPDQTPKRILERWHEVATLSLSSATSTSIHPLHLVLQKASIRSALQTFRYLRTNWRMKIVTTSVPQQYGYMIYSHMPYFNTVLRTPAEVVYDHNPTVLDFGIQQTVTADYSYMSPVPMIDLFSYYVNDVTTPITSMDYVFMEIPFGVMRTDSGVSNVVKATIWVQLYDTKTAGHTGHRTYTSHIEAQSGLCTGATTLASIGAIPASAATAICAGEQMFTAASAYVSKGAEAYKSIREHFSKDVGGATEAVAEGTSVAPRIWGELCNVNRNTSIGLLGVHCESREGSYGDSGGLHSIHEIISKPSLILRTSVTTSTSMINVDVCCPHGAKYSDTSLDRTDWVSSAFRYWRGSFGYLFYFNSSALYTSRWIINVDYTPDHTETGGFGDVISYEVNVRGSTWTNVMVPWLSANPWLPVDARGTVTGATQSYIANNVPKISLTQLDPPRANGDATPTTLVTVWRYAGPDFMFSSPQGFSVHCYDSVALVSKERFQAQSSVYDLTANPLILGDGITAPAFIGKATTAVYEDIFSRYAYRHPLTGPLMRPTLPSSPTAEKMSLLGNFDLACSLFLWWSGSLKFKIKLDPPSTGSTASDSYSAVVMAGTNNGPADNSLIGVDVKHMPEMGLVANELAFNPVLDFEAPFITNFEVMPISAEGSLNGGDYAFANGYTIVYLPREPVLLTSNATTTIESCYIAPGKSFSLYYDYPPMSRSLWPYSYTVVTAKEPVLDTLTDRVRRGHTVSMTAEHR